MLTPGSWTLEESEVESCEDQDNANIHRQPFPESVSEEREIYTDYGGCHRRDVKHDGCLSADFSKRRFLEDHALNGTPAARRWQSPRPWGQLTISPFVSGWRLNNPVSS